MSVIGRLDDQVEAILINPPKRRETGAEDARDESQSGATTAQHAVQGTPDQLSHESPDESARNGSDPQPAGLPVWLL
ncbi:MAG TPA: hypothetical protein VF656_18210 [Pyrinomonadaceae bacterium]|jgi:hypothetical protein